MQWLFNLLYKLFDSLFGLLGSVSTPAWLSDLTVGIAEYVAVANYYIPIDTMIIVALAVIGVTVIMMIVSAVLQLF